MAWRSLRKLARRVAAEARYYRCIAAHAETPALARWLIVAAVAYALSPIDLIPDFVPVLGYLDDVVIVALLIWIAFRFVPHSVRAACRAETGPAGGDSSSVGPSSVGPSSEGPRAPDRPDL